MDAKKTIPERAVSLFLGGYNCAQAVFCAFCEETGMEMDAAAQLSSALGGGLCRMRETCGAVSGGMLALGILRGYAVPGDDAEKQVLYARGQRIVSAFKDKFGTVRCRELLGLSENAPISSVPTPRTEAFYASRPCARFIYEMAALVEEELKRPV